MSLTKNSHNHDHIDLIKNAIKDGKLSLAKKQLKSIKLLRLNETEKVLVASLFRRTDQAITGLKILQPLITGAPNQPKPQVKSETKIEYAECLLSAGLLTEARTTLLHNDLKTNPLAQIKLAYSYLYDYELKQASHLLLELIKKTEHYSDYEITVMKVNCLTAMLGELSQPNETTLKNFNLFLNSTEKHCLYHSYELLNQTLSVIRLQSWVITRKINKEELAKLRPLDKNMSQFALLTEELYLTLAHFILKNISVDLLATKIKELKAKAIQARKWEILREIDYQHASVTQDQSLLLTLHNLTLYPAYREKIKTLLVSKSLEKSGQFLLLSVGQTKTTHLPVEKFNIQFLSETPTLANLFLILCQERYMPLSVQKIWDIIHPKQHYIEPSSKNAIHQWIMRLKAILKRKKIPVKIEWDHSGYRLLPNSKNKELEVNFPPEWLEQNFDQNNFNLLEFYKKLENHFKQQKHFRISDLIKIFPEIPKRTQQLYLQQLLLKELIEKTGRARNVSYSLK